ncbi:MAG: hypothetical protein P1U34_10705 [Coxiellaceae bacterium]|nr:hypothetical protein [Coxiellaceae bacterium]
MSKLKEQIAQELQNYLSAKYSSWGAWTKSWVVSRYNDERGKSVSDLKTELDALKGDDAAIHAAFAPLLNKFALGIGNEHDAEKDAAPSAEKIASSAALEIMLTEINRLMAASNTAKVDESRAVSPMPPVPKVAASAPPPVDKPPAEVLAAPSPVVAAPAHSPVVTGKPVEVSRVVAPGGAGLLSLLGVASQPAGAPRAPTVYRRGRRRDVAPSDRVTRSQTRAEIEAQKQRDMARNMTVDQFCLGGKGVAKPKATSAVVEAGMAARGAAERRAMDRAAELRGEARRDAASPTEGGEYGDYSGLRLDA